MMISLLKNAARSQGARAGWMLLLLTCSACGTPVDSSAQSAKTQVNHSQTKVKAPSMNTPVTDSSKAEEIFREFFLNKLAPQFPDNENVARAKDLITRRQLPPSVKQQAFSAYKEQLERTVGASAVNDAVIYGQVTDLQRDGQCWSVVYSGLLTGGVSGCIDATSGEPVVVWVTPEG